MTETSALSYGSHRGIPRHPTVSRGAPRGPAGDPTWETVRSRGGCMGAPMISRKKAHQCAYSSFFIMTMMPCTYWQSRGAPRGPAGAHGNPRGRAWDPVMTAWEFPWDSSKKHYHVHHPILRHNDLDAVHAMSEDREHGAVIVGAGYWTRMYRQCVALAAIHLSWVGELPRCQYTLTTHVHKTKSRYSSKPTHNTTEARPNKSSCAWSNTTKHFVRSFNGFS